MKKPNFSLNASPEQIAEKVLLTPDVESCVHVAETYFKNTVRFNENKNFFGCTGEYMGKRLTAISAGIGMAATGMLAAELYGKYGVQTIANLGLCDGLKEEIQPRQYVLVTAASTDSNYGDGFGLPGYIAPAADFETTAAIKADFETRKGLKIAAYENPVLHVGTVLSSDRRISDPLEAAEWTESGAIAADTNTAALFLTAQKYGKKAVSLLVVDRNIATGEEMKDGEFQRVTMRQIVLAMANL